MTKSPHKKVAPAVRQLPATVAGAQTVAAPRREPEDVVRTDGSLSLHYGAAQEERSSQIRDGLTLAKLLGASDLLLVHRSGDGLVSLRRIGTLDEKLVSQVAIAPKANADEISTAALALATSRSGRIVASGDDDAEQGRRGTSVCGNASLYDGIALATGSVATLAIGWVSYAEAAQFPSQVASHNACALPHGAVTLSRRF